MVFSNITCVAFDFDGVFTNNKVLVDQSGTEFVVCDRSDGIGIKRLNDIGIQTIVISTESNPVVTHRAKKIGIEVIQNVSDKSEVLKKWALSKNIDLSSIAFLGNDINDIPAFSVVGFPIAVADCYDEIRNHVHFILQKNGGHGAVRELCDLIYFSKIINAQQII